MYEADLAFDIGMHEGEDTEYYLKKGFRVISFEANPELVEQCSKRFAPEITSGRLRIVSGAIAPESAGPLVTFYKNDILTVWGTAAPSWMVRNALQGAGSLAVTVPRVDLSDCLKQFGTPYFIKIDIEGMDIVVLEALGQVESRPEYVSIEADCTDLNAFQTQLETLHGLGYRRYRAVQQANIPGLTLNGKNLNGMDFFHRFVAHASGPFGNDLAQEWLSYDAIKDVYKRIVALEEICGAGSKLRTENPELLDALQFALGLPIPGWFDIHASL